jgi:hypothetical protein
MEPAFQNPDFLWRNPSPKPAYDIVIVGGGLHGLSTAYYLAKNHGLKNVAVVERGWLGNGNAVPNTLAVDTLFMDDWDLVGRTLVEARPVARVATAAVLCLAANYSYSNGMFTWVLAGPVVATTTSLRWLAPWVLGFLLNAAAYFRGYVQPPDLMSGLDPVRLAHYFLAFLGAPLGVNRLAVATTVGAVLLVAFALVCAYWLTYVREDGLRRRLAPWLSLGGYAVLSGIAAAVGRSNFGIPHSLSNRYVPFSLYLAVALVGAIPIIWSHRREHAAPRAHALGTARMLLASGLAGFFVLHAASAAIGVGEMIRVSRMVRYGKTCLLFILVHPDGQCLGDWVYPRPEAVVETARDLVGLTDNLTVEQVQDQPRGPDAVHGRVIEDHFAAVLRRRAQETARDVLPQLPGLLAEAAAAVQLRLVSRPQADVRKTEPDRLLSMREVAERLGGPGGARPRDGPKGASAHREGGRALRQSPRVGPRPLDRETRSSLMAISHCAILASGRCE